MRDTIRFDYQQALKILCKEVNISVVELIKEGKTLKDIALEWFVKERNIKVPNRWKNYFTLYYPGLRKIKRNKHKFLPALLKDNDIHSK